MDFREVIQSPKGVRFQCVACGHCCSGESEGLVFIYKQEVQRIASELKMSEADFLRTYCDVVEAAYKGGYVPTIVIKMNPTTQNCIFQQPNGSCKIYAARPFQCKSFPFWALNVENATTWEKLKETCPGFATKETAPLYSIKEIKAFLEKEQQLEDEHYNLLKQNEFNFSTLYPCLEKKDLSLNVIKSLDRQHSGTISRRSRSRLEGDSPNTRGD